MPVNRNLTQRSRQALYTLKREYGAQIDIYKLSDSQTDVRTGVKTQSVTVLTVPRAVVMPEKVVRVAPPGVTRNSASKYQAGGHYDQGTREFIIDRRDVPTLPELTENDWIVYDGRKFQIHTTQAFEVNSGWIIVGQEILGEVPEQPATIASSSLGLVSTPDASVEGGP